jgi:hypothetical protein
MYMYEKRIARVWTFLGAMAVCLLGGLTVSKAAADSNDLLYHGVVEALRENITKVTSAILVSRTESIGYGPWSGRSYKGQQQLWWSGEKLAVSNTWESIRLDENGELVKATDATVMAWNGKDFRVKDAKKDESGKVDIALLRQPSYSAGQNYLQDVGWQGGGLLGQVFAEPLATEPGTHHWSTEDAGDAGKLIKWEFRNSRTGQVGKWYYDIGKGCGLVCYENYASPTQLAQRTTIRYEQVSKGAWFPVDVNTLDFNIQTGQVLLGSRTQIDLAKSVFDEPSAIPEGVFELEIGPNMEVSDYLLGERLLYSTDASPLAMEELDKAMNEFYANDPKRTSDPTRPQAGKTDGSKKSSDADVGANRVLDSNRVGVISQAPVGRNDRSVLAWFLIAVGAVVCVLGTVVWRRRSRRPSDYP